jgi:hypothetical protein
MSELEILARILLAIAFGAVLGLETETRGLSGTGAKRTTLLKQRIGGVRTYTVLTLIKELKSLPT